MIQQQEGLRASATIATKNKFVNLLFVNAELRETTFKKTIALYVFMSLVFLTLAIVLYVVLNSVVEIDKVYYSSLDKSKCLPFTETGEPCVVEFTLKKPIEGQVYLMYQIENFYQNHRRYLQSKSNYQLAGNTIQSHDALICKPYITNQEMGKSVSWTNTPLDPKAVASPCGAIAKTFFNDTFQLKNSEGSSIFINETGISWPGDQGYKYKRAPNSESVQWIDPEDEHFIVWMRTSGLPNFRKLWGRIEGGLPAGTYTVEIKNNYDSKDWEGDRSVVITGNSVFGGKNFLMPSAFMVLGVGCIVASIFFYRKWLSNKNHGE